jgi:ribosome maturation factor RimP
MATGAPAGVRARITATIEPVVAASGLDLEEVRVSQAGRRTVVRVVIDADGGVTLDDIAAASRAVSAALDEAEAADGPVSRTPYTLEVTSPGVDRPLTAPRHWRRNRGRLVSAAVAGRAVTGRVTAVDDAGVTFALATGEQVVAWEDLGPGRVQVEFSRPATGAGDDAPASDGGDVDDADLDAEDDVDADDADLDAADDADDDLDADDDADLDVDAEDDAVEGIDDGADGAGEHAPASGATAGTETRKGTS